MKRTALACCALAFTLALRQVAILNYINPF
jgi:hypothetical protein